MLRTLSHKPRLARRLVAAGATTCLLSFAALIAAVVFVPDREAPLSGGKGLYYLGATWGTHHRCVSGRRWQRTLLSIFPLPQLFGGQVTETTTTGDSAVVWVRGHGKFPEPSVFSDHGPLYQFEAVDEHGCRFGENDAMLELDSIGWRPGKRQSARANLLTLAYGGDVLLYAPLAAYPRRDGSAWIDVRSVEVGTPAGPAVARFPLLARPTKRSHTWRAESYPITREVSGVHFRCFGVEHPQGMNDYGWFEPQGTYLSRLRYRAYGLGGTWRAVRIDTADETGNQVTRQELLESTHSIFAGLCLRENAWKLRVSLLPVSARTTPDEVWSLRVWVPERGAQIRLDRTWSRGGLRLVAHTVSGAGAITGYDGQQNEQPELEIVPSASVPFAFAVLPKPGFPGERPFKPASYQEISGAAFGDVYDPAEPPRTPIRVPLPDLAGKSITLALRIWRSRCVEFYAKP